MSTLELAKALFDYKVQLIAWVLFSILIYALSTNLLHFLRSVPSGRFVRLLKAFDSWPHSIWFFQALRFLYYLCIPYVALTRGLTNTTLMGMWQVHWFGESWFQGLALGTVLGLGLLVLLVWGWRQYLQAAAGIQQQVLRIPYLIERRILVTPWGWGLIVLDVLYLEMHWAFYRSATIRMLGAYYGVFLGFLLIVAEWWLNPEIRRNLSMAHRGGEAVTNTAMALGIAIIYYFTSNLWLCIAIHLTIQFGLLSFLTMIYGSPDHEGQGN